MREQDPEPLFKAGRDGLPALLITGGNDKFIVTEPLKALLAPNFSNLTSYDFPGGSHAMFYELEDEYVEQVIQFATFIFGRPQ